MRAAVFVVASIAAVSPASARPRPVPIPAVIVDARRCQTHLVGDRRAACTECTRNRGQFHTQGIKGPGVCRGQAAPDRPAPPPAPAVHGWIVGPEQCGPIERPDKRRRCQQCTRGGGRYLTLGEGWGYCKPKPGEPSPIWIVRADRCNAIERVPKRRRCQRCVGDGNRYLPQGDGWGYCKPRPAHTPRPPTPPPPPPPPREVAWATGADQCSSADLPRQMKRRCQRCVRKGHRFTLDGSNRCEPAAPPPPPRRPPPPPPREVAWATGADQCSSADLPRQMKRRCQQCVRKGHRFTLDGSNRCEPAAPPPPPPPRGMATNVEECDRALPPPRRRRCHECVQKGGTYSLAGKGNCQRARRRHR